MNRDIGESEQKYELNRQEAAQLPEVSDVTSDCKFDEGDNSDHKKWEATPTPGNEVKPKSCSSTLANNSRSSLSELLTVENSSKKQEVGIKETVSTPGHLVQGKSCTSTGKKRTRNSPEAQPTSPSNLITNATLNPKSQNRSGQRSKR